MTKPDQEVLSVVLSECAEWVEEVNVRNGWYETDRTFGDECALLHSEVSEMLEAFRDGGTGDQTKPQEGDDLPKPEGIGSEAADVLVRLLDTCMRYNIDLGYEFVRKVQFNETRGHRHGNKNL